VKVKQAENTRDTKEQTGVVAYFTVSDLFFGQHFFWKMNGIALGHSIWAKDQSVEEDCLSKYCRP